MTLWYRVPRSLFSTGDPLHLPTLATLERVDVDVGDFSNLDRNNRKGAGGNGSRSESIKVSDLGAGAKGDNFQEQEQVFTSTHCHLLFHQI